MDKEVKKHMVGGYEFNTKEDAQLAKDELNAIKYVSRIIYVLLFYYKDYIPA